MEAEDSHAVVITRGYSKNHRPDLKQMVLEMMVSQDGGIPLLMKCWSGNSDDTTIFQQRARALVEAWKETGIPPLFYHRFEGLYERQRGELETIVFYYAHP